MGELYEFLKGFKSICAIRSFVKFALNLLQPKNFRINAPCFAERIARIDN